MTKTDKLVRKAKQNPSNVTFSELCKICDHYFGIPRQSGSSHRVYKTPWPGDPRVNIQKGKNGMGKDYQVRQILKAIDKIEKQIQ